MVGPSWRRGVAIAVAELMAAPLQKRKAASRDSERLPNCEGRVHPVSAGGLMAQVSSASTLKQKPLDRKRRPDILDFGVMIHLWLWRRNDDLRLY
jgi:hypothetical protein